MFLTIKGQIAIEPSLWDKTMDDPGSVAIETLKCPIALINLMKARCTGAVAGIWAHLAPLKQFGQTVDALDKRKNEKWINIWV